MRHKTFLSDEDDGGGSVHYEIRTVLDRTRRSPITVEADLKITDCSRRIALDFWAGNATQHRAMLGKADTLINTLTKFKEDYSKAWAKNVRYY